MRTVFVFCVFSILIGCQTENSSGYEERTDFNIEIYNLPNILEETSGLAILNDTLWTINDSGNEAAIYAISPKGKLIEKRGINKKNIDWEDMTIVNGNMIVADMGNNFGTRKNLYLLKIDLSNGGATTLDSIPFNYPEQENFDFQQATPFDAEGIICIENEIVVFTKNRSSLTSEIYVIPALGGAAIKMGSLPVESLITGADYDAQSKTLVLTAYTKDGNQYLHVINNFTLSNISTIEVSKHDLNFNKAQVEAVAIIDPKTFWITSEKTNSHDAFLAKVAIP